LIIPIFIMNSGCPHRCIFCNEYLTAGNHPTKITDEDFLNTVCRHLAKPSRNKGAVQIAFYGGTFTGMEHTEQKRLLTLAAPFLREGTVDSIRISTRPDEIDADNLDFLKPAGVRTIEIGAQSFDDAVLYLSRRGHTAADNVRAVQMLRERGFQTGIHLMAGLPGDTPESFAGTVEKTIALGPDMVRIHPTVVLQNTALAVDFKKGKYLPLTLGEAIELSKAALRKFTVAGIPVIRLGLQTTSELEKAGAVVGGPFHPAFRSLVESAIFLEMADSLLNVQIARKDEIRFIVSPADFSNIQGMRRENIITLMSRHGLRDIKVAVDPSLTRGTLVICDEDKKLMTDFSGKIVELPAISE
jgi:histone acetyltransferase (RNA polymerase elongator complex component)